MRLNGRSALVTGSTDGIGAAIAQALAAEGAAVIVTGRKDSRTVAAIEEAGGQATFIRADLSRATEIRDLAAAAGPVDILVNNAAMLLFPAPTKDVDEEVIDKALSINVKAAFLLTGLLAPAMADRGEGAIINIGSISGLNGAAQSALYSTTKAAIHSLTKSWAAEYGPSGVRVNTVAPGPTLTPRIKGAEFLERIGPLLATIPSQRASTPEEVAKAVVFLASDDASNIHGATLSVDGGRAAV